MQRTHASIPAAGVGVVGHDGGIALLQIFNPRRLDGHVCLSTEAAARGFGSGLFVLRGSGVVVG